MRHTQKGRGKVLSVALKKETLLGRVDSFLSVALLKQQKEEPQERQTHRPTRRPGLLTFQRRPPPHGKVEHSEPKISPLEKAAGVPSLM